jgi:hypothetical protein
MLGSVWYWVIDDPVEIRRFINTNVRKEWEFDALDSDKEAGINLWLQKLSDKKWRLQVIQLDRIRLNPRIMNYKNERGYSFKDNIKRRSAELHRNIKNYDIVIWPLILDKEMILRDGYCRYHALRELGVSVAYAYVALV